MSDVISNERVALPQLDGKVQIPVKFGCAAERIVELGLGSRVVAILELVAAERNCSVSELMLIRDGDDKHITDIVLVETGYPHHRRHHVHHIGEVKVTVFYQAGEHHHDFVRQASVEEVLTWAIGVFKIDPAMASEFELALHGKTEQLAGSEHVGHLAGRHRELALDLVRGDIANGSGE
jgi:hypothetical protein